MNLPITQDLHWVILRKLRLDEFPLVDDENSDDDTSDDDGWINSDGDYVRARDGSIFEYINSDDDMSNYSSEL